MATLSIALYSNFSAIAHDYYFEENLHCGHIEKLAIVASCTQLLAVAEDGQGETEMAGRGKRKPKSESRVRIFCPKLL